MKKLILNILKTAVAIAFTIACGVIFGILLIAADMSEHKSMTDYNEETEVYEIASDIADTLTA